MPKPTSTETPKYERRTHPCANCTNEIGMKSTLCRECAQEVNVKYTPTAETVWAEAAAIRNAWLLGVAVVNGRWPTKGRGETLVGSRPRGGTFCGSDEEEKAFRLGQAVLTEECPSEAEY